MLHVNLKFVFCVIFMYSLLMIPGTVFSQSCGCDASGMLQGWLTGFETDLAAAEDVLLAKEPSEWTQDEIEEYLFNALHLVYNANNIYILEHRQHPYDYNVLMSMTSKWPGNPFNDWEPIRILHYPGEAGIFSPGDIILQLCPPEYYSGYPRAVPKTYVMTINGPTENHITQHQAGRFVMTMWDWDVIPAGTAFIAGSYYEKSEVTKRKIEETQKALAEQSDE